MNDRNPAVDDAPYTEDLDLASVTSHEELIALLRTVHARADKPSLRRLEAQTRHSTTPLSKTAVSELLKGARFPRKAVMVAFLRACGVRDDHIDPWRRAWERIAAHEPARLSMVAEITDLTRLREQIDELNADNARLRQELSTVGHQHADQMPYSQGAVRAHATYSPTASRRELGIRLRTLRREKRLTVEQVAEHLMCSPSKINHMETSSRAGTLRDVRDLCDLYGVTDQAERDRLLSLARDGKKTAWWQRYGLDFATYVGLEAAATGITYFQSTTMPGLMQTPDYAVAVHQVVIPRLTPERIDELIEVRLTRQRLLLHESSVHLVALLDEAVLHRLVGGPAVMRAQLGRLVELSNEPNVTIQVIPYSAGAHSAMESNFNILEFSGSMPSVVYVEGLVGWIILERTRDVSRYREVLEHLYALALSPRESIKLVMRIKTTVLESDNSGRQGGRG